ncbi:hypothetical protein GTR02_04685, partial [Kineococcus sp. R8]|nr:hypothetical protein [Kineococcus siccus]
GRSARRTSGRRPSTTTRAARAPARRAWSSTVVALKSVGLSVLIEGTAGVVGSAVWVAGALVLR